MVHLYIFADHSACYDHSVFRVKFYVGVQNENCLHKNLLYNEGPCIKGLLRVSQHRSGPDIKKNNGVHRVHQIRMCLRCFK